MEGLGITGRRPRFDTAQTHQAIEHVFGKPMLIPLCPEITHQPLHFPATNCIGQWHEKVRLVQVGVVLRNFVFQDQMVAKSIPGQFRNQTMVLMKVMPEMGEDQVRRKCFFQFLEALLHRSTAVGKKAIAEGLHHDRFFAHALQKRVRTPARFPGSLRIGAQNQPVILSPDRVGNQAQDGSATADFDVIAVCSETQDPSDLR